MSNKADATTMKQAIKRELKPKLRFPEFRDAGEWDEKRLEDICKKISQGGTPDTSIQDYWNGDVEWLTPAEMGKLETRFITTTNRKISKIGLKNCSSDLLPVNSVILSTRAPIGHLLINKSEMAINQGCKGLVPLPSTDYNYLYYSLANYKNALSDLGAGNTFKELSGSALKNFELPISIFSEQQKIADCLSSIDELVTAQTQKLDTLKTHKKGLMQQLFPAEGETLPKLRFPEFRDAGEWEENTLGNICDYWNGASHEGAITENGEYFLISLNSIGIDGNLKSDMKRLSETDNSLQKNDLVMVLSDVAHGNFLGLTDIIPANKFVLNQRMAGLRLKESNAGSVSFLRTFINKNQKYFKQKGQGSSQLNLAKSAVTDFPVLFPRLEEQQKIADCLSTIDELITAQTQKLDTLKTHKKGLMQQLFPSVGGVAGEA